MIQTTNNDIVLIGHGGYSSTKTFTLPEHVELCLVQPVGAVLKEWVMKALIQGLPLKKLVYKAATGKINEKPLLDAAHLAHVYTKTAPDLELCPLGTERAEVQGYVDRVPNAAKAPFPYMLAARAPNIMLSDLLKIQDREHELRSNLVSRMLTLGSGKRVRIYWSACAGNESDPSPPCIVPNGFGQHYVALAHALAHKDKPVPTKKTGPDTCDFHALEAALVKTMRLVQANPLDTEGVIAELNKVSPALCAPGGACHLEDPTVQVITK